MDRFHDDYESIKDNDFDKLSVCPKCGAILFEYTTKNGSVMKVTVLEDFTFARWGNENNFVEEHNCHKGNFRKNVKMSPNELRELKRRVKTNMINFDEFIVEKAWAVGPVHKNPRNEKRCFTRILAEGKFMIFHPNAREEHLESPYEYLDGVVLTADEKSISCKMILKEGKLHMGMVKNSFIVDELRHRIGYDRDDEQVVKFVVVRPEEDWSEALDREFCHCPFATTSWDCNRCKSREGRKTVQNWLSSCAVARKHEDEIDGDTGGDEMSQNEWEAASDPTVPIKLDEDDTRIESDHDAHWNILACRQKNSAKGSTCSGCKAVTGKDSWCEKFRMSEAERRDYWANKTGKKYEDIELGDLSGIGEHDTGYDENYSEARDYMNED
jgi:hypothetical protein